MEKKTTLALVLFTVLIFAGCTSLSTTGFTTISLSQVSVVSNDVHLNNAKAWLMAVAVNGGGQSAAGSFDHASSAFSNIIDPVTGQLLQPDSFTLSFNSMSQACTYPVTSESTQYDSVQYPVLNTKDFSYDWLVSDQKRDAQAWCNSIHGLGLQGNLAWGWYPNTNTYWCITGSQYGEVRRWNAKQFNFSAQLVLTTQNGTSSATVYNDQSTTLYRNGVPTVYAAWAFNGVTTQSCPDATGNVYPVYNSRNQGWNIVNQNLYQEWYSDWNNFANNYLQHQGDGQINYYVQALQEDVSGMLTAGTTDQNFAHATVRSSGVNQAYASIDETNTPVIVPVYALDLNAAEVGIYQTCSQPQIIQIDGSVVGTATNYLTGTATVKNIGNAQATYTSSLTLPSGETQIGSMNPSSFNLAPGATQQISYTFTSAQAVQGTATLKVQGAGFCSAYQDSKNFWTEFDRYCAVTCSGNFVLDKTNCVCKCPLSQPSNQCQSLDTTNCRYVIVPNCGTPVPIPCNSPWKSNSQGTGCECGLDASAAPAGQFLNATACAYQNSPTGGSKNNEMMWLGLGVAGFAIIIIALLAVLLGSKKKRRS